MAKTYSFRRNPFVMLAKNRKASTERAKKGRGSYLRTVKHKKLIRN
jgi:hypothetical protein